MALAARLAPAQGGARDIGAQDLRQRAVVRGVGAEDIALGGKIRREDGSAHCTTRSGAPISSRPISIRRISFVPAPMSSSLASRHEPFDRPVPGIARTTERLDRFVRDPHRILARQQDRARGIEPGGLARVATTRDRIDIGPRRIQRDVHVRDLGLHQLERSDRLAELLAFADIGDDHVEACLHDAKLDARQHRAFIVEPRHQHARRRRGARP